MSTARPELARLAQDLGVLERYHDLAGVLREASDPSREAVVAALGHDGSSEEAARGARTGLERRARERLLEPVAVWREHASERPTTMVRAPFDAGTARVRLELVEDSGARHERELALPIPAGGGPLRVALPGRPGIGLHELALELELGGTRLAARQLYVAAPRTALRSLEALGGRTAFGIATNLWSVRSRCNLGHGDFNDLALLCEGVAREGGDFIATSPLHLLRNRGHGIGPYSPLSRFLRNPLYLDPLAVPELARCEPARRLLESAGWSERVERWRASPTVDHEGLADALDELCSLLFACFRESGDPQRRRAFEAFVTREGEPLERVATYLVLARDQEARGAGSDWRRWAAPLRDPTSPAVREFRRERADAVEREQWIQLELERQLAAAAERGARAGLALGIVDDLAVGAPHDSADAWALGPLVAPGIELGAPPDAFAADGQAWGLAPFDPHRLRESAYAPFVGLVRGAMRHAGALRIDHVLGLFRSFWIPRGRPSSEGVYLRQPTDELLAILAVESRRQRCLVIGEDLGVVPDEVPRTLASWGILSTRVLLFEREGQAFSTPARLSPRAFLCATTHDLVPLRGWVEGADLELRAELGALAPEELEPARRARIGEVEALTRFAAPVAAEPGTRAWVGAVHAALAASPAPLVAFALDDLAGEQEPVNLPGVPIERHRSWSRRMATELENVSLEPGEAGARALRTKQSGPPT